MVLNQTKFYPPLSSRGAVPRELLLSTFEQNVDAHVVLLLAPAGFGKTTLMAQRMQRIMQDGGHASWLTLDEADNDPARLICYFYGALRDWMEAILGPTDADAVLTSADWILLLDRIGPSAPPHTLFLDEFEKLTAAPALRVAKLLVDRLPGTVQLVISSREKPLLGLERYRVRGELLEFRMEDLRFDAGETRRFLAERIAKPVAAWLIEKMQHITGGWPAALQLTTLAARTAQDLERYAADLFGRLGNIADYLAEDVLHAQATEVRAFLLETSGFPRLSAAVCDAATGRTESQRILQYLERNGLFTAQLDTHHTWYRYHPLFAEFLQIQQAQALPRERIVAIHCGAARWFARHGTTVEAVDLWLLAGDSDAAIHEMASCARELMIQAQFDTILRWVERIDDSALTKAGPELPLAVAWACSFVGDPDAGARWLARLKSMLETNCAHHRLSDELMALEVVLLTLCGDTCAALSSGLAYWQRINPAHRFAGGTLANVIAYCLVCEGEFGRARAFCNEARLYNEEIGSALGLGYALFVSGKIEAVQGNLDKALEQFHEIDTISMRQLRHPWFETTHVKMASVGLIACVLYEKDRLEEADDVLQRYFPFVMHQPTFDLLLLSHVIHARLKIAQGDVDGALDTLQRAARNTPASRQFLRAHRIIEWERVWIDFALGRNGPALACAELLERPQPDDGQQSGYLLVEELYGRGIESIRFAIVRGQTASALTRLERDIAHAQAQGRRWRLLKLLLLRTLALDAHGDQKAARVALTQALELGWRIGARRSFMEEGKRIETLLAELPPQSLLSIPGADDVKRYWLDLCGKQPSLDTTTLSERERAILALLATGTSNEQVATAVFLSVNTVKWHIRRILEKLAARNRTEAVFIARKLGLIDP